MKTHLLASAVAAVLFLSSGGAARALDIADVKNLVRNHVDEEVIVTMVLQEGALPATAGDVAELRTLGASETLVSAVTAASTGTATVPPTVYYEAPTAVAQPPVVYYETPTYVYPYAPFPRRHYYHSRPGISFSFGFGSGGRRHGRHGRPPFRRWHR